MTEPMKSALGRTENCPPIDTLIETAQTVGTRQHLETCSYCRTELALAREFQAAEPLAEELASLQWIEARLRGESTEIVFTPRRSAWDRLRARFATALTPASHRAFAAAAFAAVLLIAGGVYLRQGRTLDLRPPSADGLVWRSGGIKVAAPAGELLEGPTQFQWEAVPHASEYHVYVMEVDRTVIWSTDTRQTTVTVPAKVRAQFRPGRAFHWHVTASDASGETIASSDLQSFHILVTRP